MSLIRKKLDSYFHFKNNKEILKINFPNSEIGERDVCTRAQSFTSLKADVRQDIKGGSAFSRCLNGTFP